MSPTDWMMLVLSFYLHDFGMLVTKDEIDKKDSDIDFIDYKGKHKYSDLNEDEIFQNIYVIIMARE